MNKSLSNFIVAVDSNCDLNMNVCLKNKIVPLQLTYVMDDIKYIDNMEERNYKTFYNKMRKGIGCKTYNANIYEYMNFWYNLLKYNLPILHICAGSGINNSYSNALIARQTIIESSVNAKIYIIDSTLTSLGCGVLALKAVEYRNNNIDIESTYKLLEEIKLNINTCYATKNLKYLNDNDRIANKKRIKGTKILSIDKNGKLILVNKKIHNNEVIKSIKENIEKNIVSPDDQTLYICYADNYVNAKIYGEKIKEELKFKNVFYSSIGPTNGCVTGPDFIAMYYFGNKRISN